ncbi:MAG: glycosyltransferase family 39 protein, partial [Deltaproteobacteria bacterium]|nr:glycosyltransferase family 39 protein [Deltaproteobacteria bacterium]
MVSVREKIFIIAVLSCFYLIETARQYQPYTFLHGDGAFYAQINRGLFKSFTLRQEEFQPVSWYEAKLGWNRNLSDSWSNVAAGRDNEWYPKHAFLMPLFSTPFYAVFGSAGLLIFNVFALITGLYFAYIITRRFFEPLPSFTAIMLTAVSPIFTRGAYSYSNDIFYAALLAIFLHFFLCRRMLLSGLFAGFALWAKPTNIVFAAPAAIFFSIALKPSFRELSKFALSAFIPIALFLASNLVMFGSPLTTSYDRILVVINGVQETVSYLDFFNLPFYDGLV